MAFKDYIFSIVKNNFTIDIKELRMCSLLTHKTSVPEVNSVIKECRIKESLFQTYLLLSFTILGTIFYTIIFLLGLSGETQHFMCIQLITNILLLMSLIKLARSKF